MRSIPAPAGEPRKARPPPRHAWVYLRACGGTMACVPSAIHRVGLSPRPRGNHGNVGYRPDHRRSIPAPAGEPYSPVSRCLIRRVYPRACGGTTPTSGWETASCGLSPRLRGNLIPASPQPLGNGSIPAPAGEPQRGHAHRHGRWVYPRACGGTEEGGELVLSTTGLSPRLRGNHPHTAGQHRRRRSIPAPAGEPRPEYSYEPQMSVYPRACGGTSMKVCLMK